MCACGEGEAGAGHARPVAIRPGRAEDATALARLHAEQIAGGFLSSLGPRFLERLYRRMCRTASSFIVVAEAEGGRVAGFVAGSTATGRLFASFLLRDGPAAAVTAPAQLLSSWRRVLETLRHGRARSGVPADAELLAIAVHPDFRRRRLGERLVGALLDESHRRGARTVEVVVGADNEAAVALYRACGFEPERRFELHAGTESLTLLHRDPAPHAAGGSSPR